MKISGQPIANLIASTSGTDSDWVVKLIDLYPTKLAHNRKWAAINSWLLRYFPGPLPRKLRNPKAIAPDKPLLYRFALPTATTSSCPATASWCKSNPAGSRSTT